VNASSINSVRMESAISHPANRREKQSICASAYVPGGATFGGRGVPAGPVIALATDVGVHSEVEIA
jgi:hypothetical protein